MKNVVHPITSGDHVTTEKKRHFCERFAALVEAELSACYRAVLEKHGRSAADGAAEHWLRAFESSEINFQEPQRTLRDTTVAAVSALLASLQPCLGKTREQQGCKNTGSSAPQRLCRAS